MKTLSHSSLKRVATIKQAALILSILWIAVYAWFYYAEPFAGPGYGYIDNWALDILTLIASVAAAGMATLVAGGFQPGEYPRRIWFSFAAGWWCWVAGEITGMVYDYYYWQTSYPDLTLIDAFWSAGYICFGLALFYQFRLIYSQEKTGGTWLYLALILAALLLTLGLSRWARHAGMGEGTSGFALYLSILYPVFDLVEGGAAIWLFFLFGRGKWGRPWWGLIAFAIADSINIYFWMGGEENLAENTVNLLYLFSDTMYISAYLIVALTLLSLFFVLHSGPLLQQSK